MFLRNLALATLALAMLLLADPRGARAALYSLSYTETMVSAGTGAGNFSIVIDVTGGIVTAVTGTTSLGGTVTGVLGLGVFANNDNAFSPTAPYVTLAGISFATATRLFNLYDGGGGPGLLSTPLNVPGFDQGSFGSLTVAAVPEPGTLALLGAGLLGLVGLRRRRAA